ncbi:hypothetical protein [Enterovirga sp.]|uniref:hypothetical protein n=1 Tax=Enterovirga sp. TaxID=2026350 RepID=UPI002C568927|nr:hypothetical protein [Enterovirga sp.]HMO30932.1 hypothetical protein [Enterovirga sp.]
MRRRRKSEIGMWLDMAGMAFEASQVIPLRLMRIAAGGAAGHAESRRMVQEKLDAAARAGITLAAGGSPQKVVRQVRSKVRANRKRLARGA